jgi:hypothetical protein
MPFIPEQEWQMINKEIKSLTDEIEKLREAFGLSQEIDYERFKAGLPGLGPINKHAKKPSTLTDTQEEILGHIRDTMAL